MKAIDAYVRALAEELHLKKALSHLRTRQPGDPTLAWESFAPTDEEIAAELSRSLAHDPSSNPPGSPA